MHVYDNLVYISHYSVGIKIVDIFDPTDPIEIAAYDTYPQGNGSGYVGCWGAFPFTNNGMIYASDMQNGFYVFDFEVVDSGWVNGNIYFNDTVPLENASIQALLNNKIFHTDENGLFNIGFPEGEHAFTINEQDTVLINFLPHQITTQNILIGNELILGDVNQDMVIDILDIINIVNIVLDNFDPNEEEFWCSDMNNDSIINIQDIIIIVQLILNN